MYLWIIMRLCTSTNNTTYLIWCLLLYNSNKLGIHGYIATIITVAMHAYTYVTGFGKTCIVHTSDFAHSKVHKM